MKPIDLASELARLTFLENRTMNTPPEAEEGVFAELAQLGDADLYAGGFSGSSPWERHPRGDELVHVLDGHAVLTVLTDAGPEALEMGPGTLFVVPRGTWHRFDAPEGVTLMTATPPPTEHSTADDPRVR
jgi:mannose-6-phosphate isomerase-like protein (cupin superfamily)